jgi:hypothetical protein
MRESGSRWRHPALKQLVAEASQALALLDAARLEELALSCRLLNRDLESAGDDDRALLAGQAREATQDMDAFARILEVTRSNLNVMNRLRELRAGRLEYGERRGSGWATTESRHGDN